METLVETGFMIEAKTCTLKVNTQKGRSVILEDGVKYVIPIYQRPYSWTNEQISKFLSDIFLAYWGTDKKIVEEPMFIGTMQLSERNTENNSHQIIDGQQRLTTFLLLFKVLLNKFPNSSQLKGISFDWLETKVNNNSQQKAFNEFAKLVSFEEVSIGDNIYINNALFIRDTISDLIADTVEESEKERILSFDIDHFVKFVLSKIYFVVIETRASLSKTLQIFNAINTTGLDLNGGDIFKLRMYEYLRDKKGYDDEKDKPFEKISELYERIDANNQKNGWVTDIHGVLDIYKYILVAKYDLPKSLYFYGADRFFEELFDTLANTNRYENFKNLEAKGVELSLSDLDKIITSRFKWHSLSHSSVFENGQWHHLKNFPTAEDACSWEFIWWSRYSRYHILAYIFLNQFQHEEDCITKLFKFNRQLSKLFIIYSIRYQKLKSEIYYQLMYEVIDAIVNKSYDEVLQLINNGIGTLESHKGCYDLELTLNGGIVYNAKLKNIICRLSAMLDEDYKSMDNSICEKLFHSEIDIEHIQAFNDSNEEIRPEVWKEWGENINSIGNLVVLERSINRSISNNVYKSKNEGYKQSSYSTIKMLTNEFESWDLNSCITRKQKEVNKIINYLFK